MNNFPWRMAFRIAWRESRASSTKFLFALLAVSIGVGSLVGVRGFSRSFRSMLLKEARTLMAADLSVRVFDLPSEIQNNLFADLERRGVKRTWLTETVSMMTVASPTPESVPILVSVKSVDPKVYPFYGVVKLTNGTLESELKEDTVLVSEDLLTRLNIKIGDKVRLGTLDLKVGAVITAEPDRMAGSLNVGPRVMIRREALEKAGLMQAGSRAAQRHLFKLPAVTPGTGVEEVRAELKKAFPEAIIADFRETHPLITRGLDQATTFLSLISLIALIVGSIGVATAMQSHLQQKMDSIAVMKSLGASSYKLIRIYMTQALGLALVGGVGGLIVGLFVQWAFPLLLSRYFNAPQLELSFLSCVEGILVAILSTMLFTLPTLLSIRRIRPSIILRREMEETKPRGMELWKQWREAIGAGALILVGICGIAAWLIGGSPQLALKIGAWFAGGLVVSMLVLSGLAWLMLRGLRIVLRLPWLQLPTSMRHGIANLNRPGNHAEAILVALGLGVMFTLTVYLVQHTVLSQLIESAPPGMPNVFLINITPSQRPEIEAFLKKAKGVEAPPEITTSVNGRLTSVDGKPIDGLTGEGPARRFRRSRAMTWAATVPPNTEVFEGKWWTTSDPNNPQVAVAQEAARILNVKVGMKLEWMVGTKPIAATVAAIHKTDNTRPGSNIEFILTPGVLEQMPALYFGGVHVKNSEIGHLQRDAFKAFPSITIINIADVLERVQEVVDQIALVVRFISAFSILAGITILASSVAGTRFRRIREVVILKTLGATRRRVGAVFFFEFLIIGLAAGLLGSLLASTFSGLLLKYLLKSTFHFSPLPNLVAIAMTATIATASGWLASYKILGQKPLEILRQE